MRAYIERKDYNMVLMKASTLDHRNIGSNVTIHEGDMSTSGSLALVIQDGLVTELFLTQDDESFTLTRDAEVEVNLPPAAAYTLHLKNTIQDFLRANDEAFRPNPGPDLVHLLLADVGQHQLAPGVVGSPLVQLQRCRQLGELLHGKPSDLAGQLGACSVAWRVRLQPVERLADIAHGLQIGLEIFRTIGQQIAALSTLGLREIAPQRLNLGLRRRALVQCVQRFPRLLIRGFTDEEHRQRGQRGQREREPAASQT